jgi:hypothetical protein
LADNETLAALAGQVADLRDTLAAQIGDLRDTVNRLRTFVMQWDARLESEGIGATLLLRTEVKHLAEALDEALLAYRLKPPPAPYWLRLEAGEHHERLAVLRGWVEKFLRVEYPDYTSSLPACWASHPEAIWELSTLMTEWLRIYGDERNRDLGAALWWHERWLPGVIGRLARANHCDEAGCRRARRQ